MPQPAPTENWSTQLHKGVLELLILNALAGERRYGYELSKVIAEVGGPEVREGTVYPILSRLRRDGLLRASLEESAEGPARKYYELSAVGRRKLEQMNEIWDRLATGIARLRRRT